jgi:transposase
MGLDKNILIDILLEENKSVSEIAKTFNVHKATIYRLTNVT